MGTPCDEVSKQCQKHRLVADIDEDQQALRSSCIPAEAAAWAEEKPCERWDKMRCLVLQRADKHRA